MIYCLTGKLIEKSSDFAVISCGGVGYYVYIPSTTAGALGAVGEETTLYTHMNVTENDVSLYGFSDAQSRVLFLLLTSVSGVGPKVGLAILSALKNTQILTAVSSADHKSFTAANGVGPKLAQRIVLELKDKVAKHAYGNAIEQGIEIEHNTNTNMAQAMAALTGLGYTAAQAASALADVDTTLPTSEIIRLALQSIGKRG